MKRLIIVGSPRSGGRSAMLAEMLFEACIDECPEDELTLVPVAEVDVDPCMGCGACETAEGHECVIVDDMDEIRSFIDEADELTVVAPVYFSGAPAQLKALLDRFQPYFWTWEAGGTRRPCTLHVVGEGTNPNGFEALIAEVKSAVAVAGFKLERVVDWVGKISPTGEIEAEGDEYVPTGSAVEFARIDASDVEHVHVIHEEALARARKAQKKERQREKQAQQKKAQQKQDGQPGDAKPAARGDNGGTQARPKLDLGGNQNSKGGAGNKGNKGGKGGGRG